MPHLRNSSNIHSINRIKQGKTDVSNTLIHDRSLSWLGTDTSIKQIVVFSQFYGPNHPLNETMRSCKCFQSITKRCKISILYVVSTSIIYSFSTFVESSRYLFYYTLLYIQIHNCRRDFDLWCFNATFNNIPAISWRPVLVVEEAGVPGENHRPWASNW